MRLTLLALLLSLAALRCASADPALELGPRDDAITRPSTEECSAGTLYVNHDGTVENGYAWCMGWAPPYYGAFADRVQELLGADRQDPPFVAMLSNGTSGDVNNIDPRTAHPAQEPYAQIRHVAGEAANEVLRVVKASTYRADVTLAAAQTCAWPTPRISFSSRWLTSICQRSR